MKNTIRNICLCLLAACIFLSGCGSKNDEQATKQTASDSTETPVGQTDSVKPVRKGRIADKPVPHARKEEPDRRAVLPEPRQQQKVLSAEEQMKEYYREKGIEYPETAEDVSRLREESRRVSSDLVERKSPRINQSAEQQTPEPAEATKQNMQSTSASIDGTAEEGVENVVAEQGTDQPDYSDAEPPEVIDIAFVPSEAFPGDSVTILVQAVDNLSGVASIYGVIHSPSKKATLSFSCPLLEDDGKFSGVIKIPEHAEEGQWLLSSLRLADAVNNSKNYSQNARLLRNSFLTVVNSDSDTLSPELRAVTVDPREPEGGDKVNITIQAVDEKSGVARVYGVYASPSANARLSFSCMYDVQSGLFNGSFTIPEDAQSGVWRIEYIRLEDEAKNSVLCYEKDFSSLFHNAEIQVYTRNSDGAPPALARVSVYPFSVAYKEEVEIAVQARDDVSGIASVTGRLKSPSGIAHIPFVCNFNSDRNEYTARIIIQMNTEVGTWRVDNILVIDNARNQHNYIYQTEPVVEQATFEVVGE
ncbi:MAG: hypothetical protein C4541_03555 [Candidatus Auribacter fodinae]|uniref:Lipoprotein n=1 Tax=Candidatus Auribacter fodinae TaxID=2093366 RepID=A0A3A4R720_9BACT|nr:MAG: hypothetical protein C4541_03555 [Candidatus Auribacter fodinae]